MHHQEQMNGFNVNDRSALRESQGDYRTLFDLAPIAVYSCEYTRADVVGRWPVRAAVIARE